jgi:DUF4097 and DUF4098 domain-containing protein YvlB
MKISLSVCAAVLLFASCVVSFHQDLLADETSMYEVKPSSELTFENTNGDIEVSVWDSDSVQVRTLVYGDSTRGIPEDLEIRFDHQESVLTVTVEYPSSLSSFCTVDIVVSVPDSMHYAVTVEGTNGDIAVTGVETVNAETTNGDISVEAFSSEYLETTNGDICAELSHQSNQLIAETTNGDIVLMIPSALGVSAETVNGDITVNGLEFENSATIDGSGENGVVVQTVNGDVVVENFNSGK